MKICPYHLNNLERRLQSRGIKDKEKFFKAQAIIMGVAHERDPDRAGLPGCPICMNVTQDWIRKAIAAVEQADAKK